MKLFKERVSEIKSKRNYIQMDRDMVEQFYHNTETEIDEVSTRILNREADAEQMQNDHNTEVKVFIQKLKLLEYEQEKADIDIEGDGEGAKTKENKYFDDRMKDMKRHKHDLKKQHADDEKTYIEDTDLLEKDHKTKEQYILNEHADFLADLEKNYEDKLGKMKEELELKLRVEIH